MNTFLREHGLPLAVVIIGLALLAGVTFLLQLPATGQVISTPILAPLNLIENEMFEVNLAINPVWKITFKDSANNLQENIDMAASYRDGILNYSIIKQEGSTPVSLAQGFLNSNLPTSDGLYIDTDRKPDLEVRLVDANIVRVKNLNYIAPDTTLFRLFNGSQSFSDPAVYVADGSAVTFLINASSSSTPQVNGSFAESVVFTFRPQSNGVTSTLMNLTFTPQYKIPYHFTVSAKVGNKVTTQQYVFASGGVIYRLSDPQYPEMNITINPTLATAVVTMAFPPVSQLQPFSIPCSTSPISASTLGSALVYGYGGGSITAWRPEQGVMPDLTQIEPLHGYVLKLRNAVNPSIVPVSCSLATPTLPSLTIGWNLVGIIGYQPVTLNQLSEKVPAAHSITNVYELQKGGAYGEATTLVPGKAYWVYVQ